MEAHASFLRLFASRALAVGLGALFLSVATVDFWQEDGVSVAPEERVVLMPAQSAPVEPAASPEAGDVIGSGEASYYGQELAGNQTASGERFDPEAFTAAHRTLPLGSRIRVVNEQTGASVIVRVNDRGPFAKDRVLDVSEGAAREIGMIQRGTAHVRMERVPSRRG